MELLTIVHARKIEYIPIIYAFIGKIKRHILFFDHAKQERAFAEELKISIEKLYAKYNLQTEIKMIKIDEDSKKDMQQIAQVFEGKSQDIYLNGAGADTAIFTVLSSIILRNHGKVLAYDNEDNSYNIITQNGFTNEKIKKSMNLEDFMILMGEEILDEMKKGEILAQRDALNLLFLDVKRMFDIRFLLKQRKTKELKKRYPQILESLKILGIVNDEYIIKGQEGFVKFGYLFEAFIYLQLDGFDFDDTKVGVKIRFDKEQVARRNIEVTNEFDILIIKENKIGFIECKIGDSHDPLGTVYKSDSIMEYFGESASSLIVNIERKKYSKNKKSKMNFGASVLFRAETKKVSVYNTFNFSRNSFRNKVKKAFGVDIKPEFLEAENRKSLNELVNKWKR